MSGSSGLAFGGINSSSLFVSSRNTDGVLQFSAADFSFQGNVGQTYKVGGFAIGPDINSDGVGELYATSSNTNSVVRYDGATGDFIDIFVTAGAGGLSDPGAIVYDAVRKLFYVASLGTNQVLAYSASSGQYVGVAAQGGGLDDPEAMTLGPDGNLYVASAGNNDVLKFNPTTGQMLAVFVAAGSGGLTLPRGLAFGPNGNLFVASYGTSQVFEYNGKTGAFVPGSNPDGSFPNAPGAAFKNPTTGLTQNDAYSGNVYVSWVSGDATQKIGAVVNAVYLATSSNSGQSFGAGAIKQRRLRNDLVRRSAQADHQSGESRRHRGAGTGRGGLGQLRGQRRARSVDDRIERRHRRFGIVVHSTVRQDRPVRGHFRRDLDRRLDHHFSVAGEHHRSSVRNLGLARRPLEPHRSQRERIADRVGRPQRRAGQFDICRRRHRREHGDRSQQSGDRHRLHRNRAALDRRRDAAQDYIGYYLPDRLPPAGNPPTMTFGLNLSSLAGLGRAALDGTWKLEVTDTKNDNGPTQYLVNWGLDLNGSLQSTQPRNSIIGTTLVVGALFDSLLTTKPFPALNYTSKPIAETATPIGYGPAPVIASDNTLGSLSAYQGRLYAAYVVLPPAAFAPITGIFQDSTNIALSYSDDGGATWKLMTDKVNDDNGLTDGFSESYNSADGLIALGRAHVEPNIAVDPSTGTLALSWYDARNDAARARVATYIAVSEDGGQTFAPQSFANTPNTVIDAITQKPVVLGPIPDNQSPPGLVTGNFDTDILDYSYGTHQGLAFYDGLLYPAWSGNLNGGPTGLNLLDIYTAPTLVAAGPRVIGSTMGPVHAITVHSLATGLPITFNGQTAGDGTPTANGFVVTFDRAINASTFTNAQASVIYRNVNTNGFQPGLSIPIISVTPLQEGATPQGPTEFLVQFAPQNGVGTYSYTVGPKIQDTVPWYNGKTLESGHMMDQNANGVAGETNADVYADPSPTIPGADAPPFDTTTLPLIVPGPDLVSTRVPGAPASSDNLVTDRVVNAVDATYDRQMLVSSFTPADVLNIIGPVGGVSTNGVNVLPSFNASIASPLPIADNPNTPLSSTLNIAGNGNPFTIASLQVRLDISTTDESGITVNLIGPDNTAVQLFSGVGFNGHDFQNTTLADSAFDADRSRARAVQFGLSTVAVVEHRVRRKEHLRQMDAPSDRRQHRNDRHVELLVLGGDHLVDQRLGEDVPDRTAASADDQRNLRRRLGVEPRSGQRRRDRRQSKRRVVATFRPAHAGHATTDLQFHGRHSTGDRRLDKPDGDDVYHQRPRPILGARGHPDDQRPIYPRPRPDRPVDRARRHRRPTVHQHRSDRHAVELHKHDVRRQRPDHAPGVNADPKRRPAVLRRLRAQKPLAALDGIRSQGPWKLVITKIGTSAPTSGAILNWILRLNKPVPSTGLGEPVADQQTVNFRIFTQNPTNPLSSNTWTAVGPTGIGAKGPGLNAEISGDVTAVVPDPVNPSGNTVYVGASGGGIWKTTDFLTKNPTGPTWLPLMDFGPTFATNISSIALYDRNGDPNQTIVLAATGDGNTLLTNPPAAANGPTKGDSVGLTTHGFGFLMSQDGGRDLVGPG